MEDVALAERYHGYVQTRRQLLVLEYRRILAPGGAGCCASTDTTLQPDLTAKDTPLDPHELCPFNADRQAMPNPPHR